MNSKRLIIAFTFTTLLISLFSEFFSSPTFPEIELDKVKRTLGMDITIVTTAKTNEEAKDLLTKLGMPFAKK